MDFVHEFEAVMAKNNLSALTEGLAERFLQFTEHLLEVNQITNLTAIRDVPSILSKHYADSLLVSSYIPEGARVLDLGCGPGFPSIPLAIARPDLQIVALDSTSKKIDFLCGSAKLLELKNLNGISGRAEDRAISKQLGKFDVVVSRAVANLSVLSELCIPYLKIGGVMLAMKGAKIQEEVKELLSGNAIKELGADSPEISTWNLIIGDESEMRGVVRITKTKESKPIYPRVYAQILKKPL